MPDDEKQTGAVATSDTDPTEATIEEAAAIEGLPEFPAVINRPAAKQAVDEKKDAVHAEVESVEPANKEEQATGDTVEEPYTDSQFESAVTALRASGVPENVLEKLNAGEAVAWSEKITAKPIDDRVDQLQRVLDKVLAERQGGLPAVDARVQELLEKIKAEAGDDTASAIAQLIDGQDQRYQARLKELEQQVEQERATRLQKQMRDARDSLLNDYPRIKNPAVYTRVLARAKSLYGSSDADQRYQGDLVSVMRDAALLELGPAVTAQQRKSLIDGNKNRRLSQPTATGKTNSKPDSAKTREQLEFEVFQLLEAGKNQEARDLGRSLKDYEDIP